MPHRAPVRTAANLLTAGRLFVHPDNDSTMSDAPILAVCANLAEPPSQASQHMLLATLTPTTARAMADWLREWAENPRGRE